MELAGSLARLERALAGRSPFAPFVPATGASLEGGFEVRDAQGRVRRTQPARLALPAPLLRLWALGAPREGLSLPVGGHALVLWAPAELIELQVGYRWHGFNGKRMREWDERFVVFAEDGGDPLALRLDEQDGPVWLSHRGEGRHAFREAAPTLAAFLAALAAWLETGTPEALAAALRREHGERADRLWLWRQLVSREEARR